MSEGMAKDLGFCHYCNGSVKEGQGQVIGENIYGTAFVFHTKCKEEKMFCYLCQRMVKDDEDKVVLDPKRTFHTKCLKENRERSGVPYTEEVEMLLGPGDDVVNLR